MKIQKPFFTLLICTFLMSCALKVPIDKNKVASDITIEFVSNKLIVKQGSNFLLSENGFKANTKVHYVNKGDAIQATLKKFKKEELINYDVIIRNPKLSKPYYGKIAFFNAHRIYDMNAVSRFREITIDAQYFQSATSGRIAIIYEYTQLSNGYGQKFNIPTWVLLMSDEPF